MGCLLGGLGQELSGVSELFAKKIDHGLSTIGENLAKFLAEAKLREAPLDQMLDFCFKSAFRT